MATTCASAASYPAVATTRGRQLCARQPSVEFIELVAAVRHSHDQGRLSIFTPHVFATEREASTEGNYENVLFIGGGAVKRSSCTRAEDVQGGGVSERDGSCPRATAPRARAADG